METHCGVFAQAQAIRESDSYQGIATARADKTRSLGGAALQRCDELPVFSGGFSR